MPCSDELKTYRKAQPLSSYLETALHRKIIIQVPHNYDEFFRIIRKGGTDFAFQSPHLFLQLEDHYKTDDLLTSLSVSGKKTCTALLVARADSDINNIEDLKGKTVLFGPEYSTVKTLAGKNLLKKHGINLETDLKDYRHGDNCKQIALNVYLKTADAGFICSEKYYARLRDNQQSAGEKDSWPFPANALKIIGQTGEELSLIISAMKSVDQTLLSQVKKALLALNENQHKTILEMMESGGFVDVQPTDLLTLRKQFNQQ